jgi:hypothetical protein
MHTTIPLAFPIFTTPWPRTSVCLEAALINLTISASTQRNIMFVETQYGGHLAFFEVCGSFSWLASLSSSLQTRAWWSPIPNTLGWSDRLAIEFVAAAVQVDRTA